MANRTRLDEIVEEECPMKNSFAPADWVRRVAERAFRHGVEQCVATTFDIHGHTFDFNGKGWLEAVGMGVVAARKQMENVQPAPAGERCTCGGMIGAILGKAGPTVHRTDGPCFMDRRKVSDRRRS